MAEEDDRRIEPRPGISGSGMLTDPERIRELEEEQARRERHWRPPPEKGFGDVLKTADKKRFERQGVYVDSEERLALEGEDPRRARRRAEAEGEGRPEEEAAESAEEEAPPQASVGPRVPPDPRMAALHRMLDRKASSAKAPAQAPSRERSGRSRGPRSREEP